MSRLTFVVAGGLVLLSFLPAIILGPHSYITIHDNLDGEMMYKYLLVQSGQAFHFGKNAIIPNIMNGLPRDALRSGFDLTLFYYYFLEPYAAYIANQVVVHLVAFVGMFVFLRRHVLTNDYHNVVASIVALFFALIPFYTQFGLSVAGQPLLAHAFFNIRKKKNGLKEFLIITIFPFYSHFFLVGPFILSVVGLFFVYDCIREKSLNRVYLFYSLYLFLLYTIVEYNFIISFFNDASFLSHRKDWDRWNDLNVYSSIKSSFELFFNTHFHSGKIGTIYIFISSLIALIVSIYLNKINYNILTLLIMVLIICIFYGFYCYINYALSSYIHAMKYFNASRYYFFLPFLWCLILALSVEALRNNYGTLFIAASILIVNFYSLLINNNEFINNVKILSNKEIDQPSYYQFLSENIFNKINKYINKSKDSYRVVSIGMHPSVAQFNGYYTLDSYQINYDLNYKNKFRAIIENELEKNYILKDYFDKWGNRCYIFVSELGKSNSIGKRDGFIINNLELNTDALRVLGGEYVFSSVEILNYYENNMKFEKVFRDSNAYWDVYLYKIL